MTLQQNILTTNKYYTNIKSTPLCSFKDTSIIADVFQHTKEHLYDIKGTLPINMYYLFMRMDKTSSNDDAEAYLQRVDNSLHASQIKDDIAHYFYVLVYTLLYVKLNALAEFQDTYYYLFAACFLFFDFSQVIL